jgi:GntR family transcriptional regulator
MSQTSPSSAESADPPGAPPRWPATPAFSPLYQQIKGLILQSLQQGEWKPGEAIPSEMELAARFRVSQGTVRKAIDELAAENLVVRRQGKGTFVATHAEQHVQYRFSAADARFRRPSVTTKARRSAPHRRLPPRARQRRRGARSGPAQWRPGDAGRGVLSFAGVPPSWKTSGCPDRPSRA